MKLFIEFWSYDHLRHKTNKNMTDDHKMSSDYNISLSLRYKMMGQLYTYIPIYCKEDKTR